MRLRTLISDERGAAAVEFAMLALPTISLIFVCLQTMIVFFFDQYLQTAVKDATRQLMTGAAQSASMTQAQYATSVCTTARVFDCNRLYVDVQSASTFAAANTATPNITLTFNGSGKLTNSTNYTPGGPGDVVIVRVAYDWPIFGGPLGIGLSDQPDGGHLLLATVVFKNEPYA